MLHESNKALRMLHELINYFLNHGMKELEMHLSIQADQTCMKVSGMCETMPLDFEDTINILNKPRLAEVEEYYWRLLGGDKQKNEVHLLGVLVDEVNTEYLNQRLSIELIRYH
jgi:hypothetical protein